METAVNWFGLCLILIGGIMDAAGIFGVALGLVTWWPQGLAGVFWDGVGFVVWMLGAALLTGHR